MKQIKSMTLREKIWGIDPIETYEPIIVSDPIDFSKCIIDQSKRTRKGRPPNPKAVKMMENIEEMGSGKVIKINIKNGREANTLEVYLHRHKKCLTNPDVSFIHRNEDDTAYITKGLGSMKGRKLEIIKENK